MVSNVIKLIAVLVCITLFTTPALTSGSSPPLPQSRKGLVSLFGPGFQLITEPKQIIRLLINS